MFIEQSYHADFDEWRREVVNLSDLLVTIHEIPIASEIPFTATGNIASTKVQTAIAELDSEKQAVSMKDQPNGYPGLDSSGKLSTTCLPGLAITSVYTASSQAAQLALTTQEGDIVIRTDLNKTYVRNSGVSGTMTDWTELLMTSSVVSVNTKTGTVSLTASDIPFTPTGSISSTDIQAAIAELDSNMTVPVASDIEYTPTGNVAATNVQAAITELDSEKASSTHSHAFTSLGQVPISFIGNAGKVLAVNSLESQLEFVTGSGSGGGLVTVEIVGNYLASSNSQILANTSTTSITVTLPSNPVSGDLVYIVDVTSMFGTNNLIVNRNGKKIQGKTEDLIIDVDDASIALVYYSTNGDWRIKY